MDCVVTVLGNWKVNIWKFEDKILGRNEDGHMGLGIKGEGFWTVCWHPLENIHQEEPLSKWIDKSLPPLWLSWHQPALLGGQPTITLGTHKLNVLGGRDGGYNWAQQHGKPLIKSDVDSATPECPTCLQYTNAGTPVWYYYLWRTIGHLVASCLTTSDSLCTERTIYFFLQEWTFIPNVNKAQRDSTSNTIWGFKNFLIHINGIPHKITSNRVTLKEVRE